MDPSNNTGTDDEHRPRPTYSIIYKSYTYNYTIVCLENVRIECHTINPRRFCPSRHGKLAAEIRPWSRWHPPISSRRFANKRASHHTQLNDTTSPGRTAIRRVTGQYRRGRRQQRCARIHNVPRQTQRNLRPAGLTILIQQHRIPIKHIASTQSDNCTFSRAWTHKVDGFLRWQKKCALAGL